MSPTLSALAARATARHVLIAFVSMALLLLGENLLAVPPGVVYIRRVTHGLSFLDFGFTPASGAHARLAAFGPAGRHAQGLLIASVDILIPFACASFGVLAIVVLGRRLFGAPGRWLALAGVPLLAMLFDYAENASIAALLLTYPQDPEWLSLVTHALTTAKSACYGGTLLLLVLAGAAATVRRFGPRRA